MEGLIHRARLVTRGRGPRNSQGEYPDIPESPNSNPWFAARLMERGGPASKRRRAPSSTDARSPRGYELLADALDENGAPVVLTASAKIETDCPILDSPTIELAGKPEKLTNGVDHIGYYAFATVVGDAS